MPGRAPWGMFLGLSTVTVIAVAASLLARGRSSPPAAPSVAADHEQSARLRAEVRRLETQLGALTGSQARQTIGVQAPASAEPAASEEQREARARAVRGALFAALEEKLAREPIDGAWATSATDRLNTAAARGAPFGTVHSVRCGSTLCKLVIAHHDAEDVRRFVESFSGDPPLEGQVVYQYEHGPSPHTTIWLTRKGEKLPRISHS